MAPPRSRVVAARGALKWYGRNARGFCLTGKSLRFFDFLCPAPFEKIFWFSENPNHFISALSCPSERGVGHRHERWDGMRWTPQRF